MHGAMLMKKPRYREPNGRTQREREPAPVAVKRLRDAALHNAGYAEWGTELGRLLLADTITESMYAAGKRWSEMAAKYRGSIGSFPVRSASLQFGRRGSQPDPDSEEGRKIATREANQAERFFAADVALGDDARVRQMVRRVCEDNEPAVGLDDLMKLRSGLMRLVSHWGLVK